MEFKLIIENHNSGNRKFPGWRKKYPKLYNIPGNSYGKNALLVYVDEEDARDVIASLKSNEVAARVFEQLSEKERKRFENEFPEVLAESDEIEPKQLKGFLLNVYKMLFKYLDDGYKSEKLKDFKVKDATAEELKSAVNSMTPYIIELLSLRDKWASSFKILSKKARNNLLEDIAKELYQDTKRPFKAAKAGRGDLKFACDTLDYALDNPEKYEGDEKREE